MALRYARSAAVAGLLLALVLPLSAQRPDGGQRPPQQPLVSDPSSPGTIAFTGKSASHASSGIFPKWKFTRVEIPEGDMTKGVVELEIDLTTVTAEKGGLTNHLRSGDFFDVVSRPKALVRIEGATPVEGQERGYDAKATVVVGDARVTLPVRFFTAPDDPNHIRGEAVVSRTRLKVGAPYDPNNQRSVEDSVRVTIDAKLPTPNPG